MKTIPETSGLSLGDAKSLLQKMKAEFIKNAGEAEEVKDQAVETRLKAY